MKTFFKFLQKLLKSISPKFLQDMMYTCEHVAYLLSQSDQLSLKQRFMLKLHQMICPPCQNVTKQIEIINSKTKLMTKVDLTPEQKLKIKKGHSDLLKKLSK